MKKTFVVTILVVLALSVLGIGSVFAQGTQPPIQRGWMHEYIEDALAVKLGLTEEQVEEQFASGQSLYQIALDNGIKEEDLATFMNEVHRAAFAKAVEDGVLTQAQADWMLQRMQNNGSYGTGTCPMHNGQGTPGNGRGYGPGMMGGQGWQNQTNP